jgi:hypothetical protein
MENESFRIAGRAKETRGENKGNEKKAGENS